MPDRNYLFNNVDWHSVDQHQRKELAQEVDSINGDRLLNTSVDDLCYYFEKKYKIEVPTLRPEDIVADQRETRIDVSGDPRRYFSNPGQPFYVHIDGVTSCLLQRMSRQAADSGQKPSDRIRSC
jgi:hypothetical protein